MSLSASDTFGAGKCRKVGGVGGCKFVVFDSTIFFTVRHCVLETSSETKIFKERITLCPEL